MVRRVKRLVRWNMDTDFGEQVRPRNRYTVVIINQPKEIERIRARFLTHLAPTEDLREICDHSIPKTDLHRAAFSFSSDSVIRDPDEIYRGPADIRYDRNLSERDEGDLIPYLDRLVLRS